MSKSLGNAVEPWDVIDRYGADALRWYFFTSKLPVGRLPLLARDDRRGGAPVPAAAVEHVRASTCCTRTPTRSDREPITPTEHCATSTAGSCHVCSATVEAVRERMDDFDATGAGRAIAAFVDELSNWYVRRSRREFWDGSWAAFETLRTCLVTVAKLLAPFCPFVADEIYDNLDGAEPSVHLCDFPGRRPSATSSSRRRWRSRARRSASGSPRAAQAKLKVRQPLRAAVVVATGAEREAIERLAEIVRDELNVHELRFVSRGRRARPGRDQAELPHARPAVRKRDADSSRPRSRPRPGPRGGGAARRPVAYQSRSTVTTTSSGADDLLITMKPLEGYQVEREGSHAVALELEIDDELRDRGLVARDRPRGAERPPRRRARGLGPDRADARRRRAAARRRARPPGVHRRRDAGDQCRLRR